MLRLQVWAPAPSDQHYQASLFWAACCLGFFGFMRAGEFTMVDPGAPPAIMSSDVAVDSHSSPSTVRVFLKRAKMDPFGRGVHIYLGRTQRSLCPVAAILRYLAVHPAGEGPLLIFRDGTPLSRERFIMEVKLSLQVARIDHHTYSGHSFRIGAATSAAAAGMPAYVLKCWASGTPRPTSCTPGHPGKHWHLCRVPWLNSSCCGTLSLAVPTVG